MDIDTVLNEALCTHEVLRRFGFDSSDIFFRASHPLKEMLEKVQVQVVLRTQCREFVINVGFVDDSNQSEVCSKWQELVKRFNAIDGGTQPWEELYEKSCVRAEVSSIAMALIAKGFWLPKTQN